MFVGQAVPPVSQGSLLDDLGGLTANQAPAQPIISNGTGNHALGTFACSSFVDCVLESICSKSLLRERYFVNDLLFQGFRR